MITIISNGRAEHQIKHQKALSQALTKLGKAHNLSYNSMTRHKGDIACWGWRVGNKYREEGRNVLVMERGYIGDRFKYTSLGWNGLNGHADFPEYPDDNLKRFHEHGGVLKPWRTGGDYILILGQVPGDASLQGKDLIPWYEEKAREAKEIYDIPVYFRPHPDCARKGIVQEVSGTIRSTGDLQSALDGALFTIAYNSNSCLDSVLNGTPCFAGDKGTMAWELCSHDLKEIIRPSREKIVSKIAWTQWTIEEIRSGEPVKGLMEVL